MAKQRGARGGERFENRPERPEDAKRLETESPDLFAAEVLPFGELASFSSDSFDSASSASSFSSFSSGSSFSGSSASSFSSESDQTSGSVSSAESGSSESGSVSESFSSDSESGSPSSVTSSGSPSSETESSSGSLSSSGSIFSSGSVSSGSDSSVYSSATSTSSSSSEACEIDLEKADVPEKQQTCGCNCGCEGTCSLDGAAEQGLPGPSDASSFPGSSLIFDSKSSINRSSLGTGTTDASDPDIVEPNHISGGAAVRFSSAEIYVFEPGYVLKNGAGLKGTTLEFKQDECQFVFMKCNEPTKYYFDSKGKFVSQTSAGGEETTTERDESGSPGLKTRSTSQNGQTVESFVESTYVASGASAGRLESQVYGRRLNPTLLVRRMVYAYYEPDEEHGNPGDLKTIAEQYRVGSAWVDKHTAYYRYYKAGEANGYESGMKYSLGYEAFARLVADPQVSDPLLATDAQVAAYADSYYEYDAQERVSKWTSRAGLLTNLYSYAESAFSDDRNHWKRKTVETRPDGSQRVTYYNYLQQTLLTELVSDSDSWIEYWSYDADGLEVLHARPSAVSGYDDSVADLDVALRPSSGLIEWKEYYASTTATETTPGGVEGYLKASGVQEGASGTPIKTLERSYFTRVVDDYSFYPIATSTVFRETNGTGAIETSYVYEWYPDSLQMKQRITTLPVVPVGQNGTGAVETTTEIYDAYGYLQWTRDARGYIGYQEHDWVTGNLVREIRDVDETKLTLPSGWSTPEGGGLHLITDYEYDALGRVTQTLGPAHDVEGQSVRTASWMAYRDLEDETLSAQGYAAGLPESYDYTLVNPVSISRESDDGLTIDSIAAVRGGKATACAGALREAGIVESPGRLSESDCFPQKSWIRWSRSLSDKHGQQIVDRIYHAIPESGEGTLGANYDETIYGYDAMARQNRVVSPSGTIERTVFDIRDLALSNWIGTNDAGATDADPTGDSAPGNDLVVVSERVYDDGADGGDGNLTQLIAHVDASTTRVTDYEYDFRDRQTVVDGEIDFWQETAYDNLDQAIRIDRRDTTSEGNLISRSETLFDDRGRTYRTIRYQVDPSTGTIGESLVDNTYYDANGNVVESRPSGSGSVTLFVYDGVARQTASYIGYLSTESSSSSESDGSLLESLVVFEQSETEYDDAGSVLFQTSRQRWHNATGTGPLQGPASDEPKSRDTCHVTWYDGLGRPIASANYGTNGDAGPPSRPDSPPASSDTLLVSRTNYNDRGEVFESVAPSGRIDRSYADDAGRRTLSIQNVVLFEGGQWQPGSDANVAVEQVYLAGGRLGEQIAHNPVTGPQAMRYEYGTTLVDSDLASNDLLVAEIYPDSSASSDRITYAYDRQSQRTRLTDQNGTTRDFEYDALGRKTADVVSVLGAGVDGSVRRIGWTYEIRGMVEKVTSYSDAAGATVANEIANVYNGFAQLVTQYQQHDGAVVTLSSPKVQYAYADGSANTIRATSLTYPDGAVLEYRYDNEAADALSRVRTLRFDSMDVCRYDYLGLGTFVRTDYLEPQLRLDYATGSGANPYAGFDRFGRVVDQLWRNYDSATEVVRIEHGYDRSSNRLYREDAVAASFGKAFDELYRYDGLDRLVDFARGNLVDGNTAIESPDWSQDWKLDAVGSWNGFEQQVVDDPAKWLEQRRTTNRANEISEISRTVGADWATPAYDVNGNMTSLPRWNAPATSWRATWDAWNRLMKLEEPDGSGWQDLQEHIYDGSNRRILRRNYISGALSETRRYLYTDRWQALEEGVFDGSAFDPERQYVYGLRYVDDVVLRDRDSDLGGSFDERFYAMQDANWNVVALCDAEAAVQRRYTYLPYGDDTGYEGDFAPHSGPDYLWTRRFASYEFDIDIELCLARHRWYDSRLGIWISRDPLPQSRRDYSYGDCRPVSLTDPTGLQGTGNLPCTGGLLVDAIPPNLVGIPWGVIDPPDSNYLTNPTASARKMSDAHCKRFGPVNCGCSGECYVVYCKLSVEYFIGIHADLIVPNAPLAAIAQALYAWSEAMSIRHLRAAQRAARSVLKDSLLRWPCSPISACAENSITASRQLVAAVRAVTFTAPTYNPGGSSGWMPPMPSPIPGWAVQNYWEFRTDFDL